MEIQIQIMPDIVEFKFWLWWIQHTQKTQQNNTLQNMRVEYGNIHVHAYKNCMQNQNIKDINVYNDKNILFTLIAN